MAALRQTAGVVGDGAEGVDGDRGAHEGQHAQSSQSHAVDSGQLAGDEERDADHQHGKQGGTGTDGVAFGDDEGFAFRRHFGQRAGGLIIR